MVIFVLTCMRRAVSPLRAFFIPVPTMQTILRLACLLCLLFTLAVAPAAAAQRHTPALMGPLGLNTVPSARMETPGTARLSVSTLDPYAHGVLGFQIAAPLWIVIRQSAQMSSLNGDPDRLYPGVDLKLQLLKETRYRPALALGLQSALGHKRMAAEYLTASKRYKSFDFTAGMAWGRLGSAAHINNPLKYLHDHFGKGRRLDGEEPNEPNNWFTGPDVGLFAGIEYFTHWIDGLSFKADWGADRSVIESRRFNYDPPAPWALGFAYSPVDWLHAGAALVGGDKLMGQLTLRAPVQNWFGRPGRDEPVTPLRAYRTGLALPGEMTAAAQRDNLYLYDAQRESGVASASLLLSPYHPTPRQIGRAARHMANHGGEIVETLQIEPVSWGLRGRTVSLQRRDLEQALVRHQGSPQEIWRGAAFLDPPPGGTIFHDLTHDRFNIFGLHLFRLILDQQVSLSEEDSGLLYRTALLLEETRQLSENFWLGGTLRFDLTDNLDRLREIRPRAVLPVRSDIDIFAERAVSLDRTFLSWMTTLKPDLHVSLTGGYLEEMYGGVSGEILWRPFGKTFVLGAEAYQVFKRDPFSDLNGGFTGDSLLTGHLQAWYEIPRTGLTIQARAGRYLAEDIGGTLALQRDFANGAKLGAFVAVTDTTDIDIFGSATHVYSGLNLRLPLGHIEHGLEGSKIRLRAAPLGRDAGQALDAPLKLYEISEPLSKRHIARHWTGVVD